jgi:hypothetical protein
MLEWVKIHSMFSEQLSFRDGQFTLRVHCQTCRVTIDLAPNELRQRYGDLSFDDLRRRLRCTRCGMRNLIVWADSDLPT